jgi:hypothetical protein
MGIARLAGQRSMTKKTATEIIGNRESIERTPMLIVIVLLNRI